MEYWCEYSVCYDLGFVYWNQWILVLDVDVVTDGGTEPIEVTAIKVCE